MLTGDLSKAQTFNNKHLPMMNALFCETSPAPVKYVMKKIGLCENTLRLPMAVVSDSSAEYLDNQMQLLEEIK